MTHERLSDRSVYIKTLSQEQYRSSWKKFNFKSVWWSENALHYEASIAKQCSGVRVNSKPIVDKTLVFEYEFSFRGLQVVADHSTKTNSVFVLSSHLNHSASGDIIHIWWTIPVVILIAVQEIPKDPQANLNPRAGL